MLLVDGGLLPSWEDTARTTVPGLYHIGGGERLGDDGLAAVAGEKATLRLPEQGEIEQYSGGLRFLLGSGVHLTLVL